MVFEPADIEKSDKERLNDRIGLLEDRLDDPDIGMYSYVISVTEEATLRERRDVSVESYEDHNVYFQGEG